MALIYLYLATWIAGGVALLSGLLLERGRVAPRGEVELERRSLWHVPVSFFAIGFGGAGLSVTMLGVTNGLSALVSTGAGVVLGTIGFMIRRP